MMFSMILSTTINNVAGPNKRCLPSNSSAFKAVRMLFVSKNNSGRLMGKRATSRIAVIIKASKSLWRRHQQRST